VIPEAEILAAFRELAADGVDVYIGTKRATGYESKKFILED
jgi:phosphatidylserine/phosphatidylglycerophosphate/cardiolipin synthase-like enzyme